MITKLNVVKKKIPKIKCFYCGKGYLEIRYYLYGIGYTDGKLEIRTECPICTHTMMIKFR